MPRPLRRARQRAPSALALPCACALALLAACGQSPESAAREARAQGARARQAAKVLVAPVERADMTLWLETTTTVESEREIQVFPRASGHAVEVFAEEGDRVESDQVLARLDRREQQLAVRDAEVALEESRAAQKRAELVVPEAQSKLRSAQRAAAQAEVDYQRDVQLASQGDMPSSVSKRTLDASLLARDNALQTVEQDQLALRRAEFEFAAAKTAIARAELALEKARVALSLTEVVAPFAGVIAKRSVKRGDAIGPAAAVFTLTDIESLRAVFYRPQREHGLFQSEMGMFARQDGAPRDERSVPPLTVYATAEALEGHTFRGAVLRVSPTVDPASGAFRVTALLQRESEGAWLLPGMLVRLRIAVGEHPQALVVPKRAFSREGGQGHVLVVRDKTARRVEAEEGYSDDQRVELVLAAGAKLEVGEPVILVGGRDVEDGTLVDAESERAPDAPAPAPRETANSQATADGKSGG
jgi:membrane fusion protein (multidrug efflux system)